MGRRFQIEEGVTPDAPGMMLVTIKALITLGGSASYSDINEKVIELEGVTEAEQQIVKMDNRSKLHHNLGWARTYLKHGGNALTNPSRGFWELTQKGRTISTIEETTEIHNQYWQKKGKRLQASRQKVKAK